MDDVHDPAYAGAAGRRASRRAPAPARVPRAHGADDRRRGRRRARRSGRAGWSRRPPACSGARRALPSPRNLPIDTFVVLMMENRSFDHYFGWVPERRRAPGGPQLRRRAGTAPCHVSARAGLPGLRPSGPRAHLGAGAASQFATAARRLPRAGERERHLRDRLLPPPGPAVPRRAWSGSSRPATATSRRCSRRPTRTGPTPMRPRATATSTSSSCRATASRSSRRRPGSRRRR